MTAGAVADSLTARDTRGSAHRAVEAYWPLAPILLGMALLALPTLAFPFGPDQAIFATIGRAINHGGFPYVDAWDQKPPGIYLLYALALRLPGPMMFRIRLFDLVWNLAAMAVLYEIARRLWNPRAAAFASLLYGAVYFTTQGWWYLAQPDGLIALPLLTAVLLWLRAGGRAMAPCLLAGALVGVAFELRFTAAPLLPALALVQACQQRTRTGRRQIVCRLLALGAGFVAVQIVLLTYLVAGHAVHAYAEATRFAAGYTRLGWPFAPPHPTFAMFLNHVRGSFLLFAQTHVALVFPAVAAMFVAWFVRRDAGGQQVSILALVAYLGILAQQKFFWYHWQLLLPFLALLAGWAWDGMFGAIEQRTRRPFAATAAKALLVGGMLLVTPAVLDYGYAQWDDFLHRDDSTAARLRYDDQFGAFGELTFSYLADVQVAEYLREHTSPGDRVYVFGYDPLVYLLSGRESASRFIYSLPLMSSWAPAGWRDEFIDEIDRNRPVYFLVQRNEGAARWITGQTEDTAAWAWKIAGVASRLEQEYTSEIEIEDFTLYRRNER